MTELQTELERLGACPEAVEWVGTRTLSEAWAECKRADRMLWLAMRMCDRQDLGWQPRSEVVLAACDGPELVLHLIPESEERPREAIRAARLCAWGVISSDAARAAARAARAADRDAEQYWQIGHIVSVANEQS